MSRFPKVGGAARKGAVRSLGAAERWTENIFETVSMFSVTFIGGGGWGGGSNCCSQVKDISY
jgi:hypothetical protein